MELIGAPKPWTIQSCYGCGYDGMLVTLRDCRGGLIALFRDWRDAETVIHAFERVNELEQEIKDLQLTNERLEKTTS